MKILVIGGMHGNEPLGLDVIKLFKKRPVNSVDVMLGNEKAIEQNCRFTNTDLNRSFPGSLRGKTYEFRRAVKIVEACAQYDLVIDFHNTHCPENDCSFVGETASPLLYDVSMWLGLNRVIIADYDCLNKYASNCVSVEISLSSEKMNAQLWYQKISDLAVNATLPNQDSPEKYRFVYRMTLEDRDRFSLADKDLKAFKLMDRQISDGLGVAFPAYPIFVNDSYTPYNYGGVLNKIDNSMYNGGQND